MTIPAVTCCDMMINQLTQTCELHSDPMDCPDSMIVYFPRNRSFGLPVRDGNKSKASSIIEIAFCPWCGSKFPENLREKIWSCIEEAGFPNPSLFTFDDPNLPEEFKSDAWWKKRNL